MRLIWFLVIIAASVTSSQGPDPLPQLTLDLPAMLIQPYLCDGFGWQLLGNKCYKWAYALEPAQATWYNAHQQCISDGSRLPVFDNANEAQIFFQSFLKDSTFPGRIPLGFQNINGQIINLNDGGPVVVTWADTPNIAEPCGRAAADGRFYTSDCTLTDYSMWACQRLASGQDAIPCAPMKGYLSSQHNHLAGTFVMDGTQTDPFPVLYAATINMPSRTNALYQIAYNPTSKIGSTSPIMATDAEWPTMLIANKDYVLAFVVPDSKYQASWTNLVPTTLIWDHDVPGDSKIIVDPNSDKAWRRKSTIYLFKSMTDGLCKFIADDTTTTTTVATTTAATTTIPSTTTTMESTVPSTITTTSKPTSTSTESTTIPLTTTTTLESPIQSPTTTTSTKSSTSTSTSTPAPTSTSTSRSSSISTKAPTTSRAMTTGQSSSTVTSASTAEPKPISSVPSSTNPTVGKTITSPSTSTSASSSSRASPSQSPTTPVSSSSSSTSSKIPESTTSTSSSTKSTSQTSESKSSTALVSSTSISTISTTKISSTTQTPQSTSTADPTVKRRPPNPMSPKERVAATVMHSLGCTWLIGCVGVCFVLGTITNGVDDERLLPGSQELSLICMHLLILFLHDATYDDNLCSWTSVLIHFFTLVYFAFLLLESGRSFGVVTAYISDPKEDEVGSSMFIVLPFLIVVTASVTYFYYYDSDFSCWLNFGHHVSYFTIVPVIIFSAVTVIFVETAGIQTRKLRYTPSPEMKDAYNCSVAALSGMLWILALSLASWGLGFAAVYYQRIELYGIVFPVNIALGVTIFIFHGMQNPTIHKLVSRIKASVCKC